MSSSLAEVFGPEGKAGLWLFTVALDVTVLIRVFLPREPVYQRRGWSAWLADWNGFG